LGRLDGIAPDVAVIVELPQGSALEQQLRADSPPSVADGEVVIAGIAADSEGRLPQPDPSELVLAVPSPESLAREPDEVLSAVRSAAGRTEPLVIAVEQAEFLREEELAPVLEAARRARTSVIVRVIDASAA
jgi:hypothetical protein